MDTSAEVQGMLDARWSSMSPAAKAAMVDAMTQDCTTLALAGIMATNVDASEQTIRYELAARRYGAELADEVYGTPSCS